MTRSTRSAASRQHEEDGTGVIGTVFGVTVFLVLLLFAVQVLVGLYATSVVTASTYDAARIVAGSDQGDSAAGRADAEAAARGQLGRFGHQTAFQWENDAEAVRLHVRARRPTVLPRSLVSSVGLSDIDRTVTVRSERAR